MGNVNASDDAKRYRDGYPGKVDNPNLRKNLDFYENIIASKPEGDTIENIHLKWLGNYHLLEVHHGYIQWLFPIREDGLNHYAEQLQLHEAKAIKENPTLTNRAIKSYELMLDFYGMKLTSRDSGEIERNTNWKERYAHLNRSFHNYLRITRILKFLGEIGLEHYKIHFVMHVLKEIFENNELKNTRESCVKYWATVLRNEEDRNKGIEYLMEHDPEYRLRAKTQSERNSDSDSDSDQDLSSKKPSDPIKPVGAPSNSEL